MKNVVYLEIEDFTPEGNLKPYVCAGKPVIIMGQGNFCGYCKQAKPAFAKFAQNGQVIACTIVSDGGETEKPCAKFFRKWDPSHRGVPAYFGFDRTGRFVKTHRGGRDTKSLIEFSKSL